MSSQQQGSEPSQQLIIKRGVLLKWVNYFRGWEGRHVALLNHPASHTPSRGKQASSTVVFAWSRSEDGLESPPAKSCLDLHDVKVVTDTYGQKSGRFELHGHSGSSPVCIYLDAKTPDSREEWATVIRNVRRELRERAIHEGFEFVEFDYALAQSVSSAASALNFMLIGDGNEVVLHCDEVNDDNNVIQEHQATFTVKSLANRLKMLAELIDPKTAEVNSIIEQLHRGVARSNAKEELLRMINALADNASPAIVLDVVFDTGLGEDDFFESMEEHNRDEHSRHVRDAVAALDRFVAANGIDASQSAQQAEQRIAQEKQLIAAVFDAQAALLDFESEPFNAERELALINLAQMLDMEQPPVKDAKKTLAEAARSKGKKVIRSELDRQVMKHVVTNMFVLPLTDGSVRDDAERWRLLVESSEVQMHRAHTQMVKRQLAFQEAHLKRIEQTIRQVQGTPSEKVWRNYLAFAKQQMHALQREVQRSQLEESQVACNRAHRGTEHAKAVYEHSLQQYQHVTLEQQKALKQEVESLEDMYADRQADILARRIDMAKMSHEHYTQRSKDFSLSSKTRQSATKQAEKADKARYSYQAKLSALSQSLNKARKDRQIREENFERHAKMIELRRKKQKEREPSEQAKMAASQAAERANETIKSRKQQEEERRRQAEEAARVKEAEAQEARKKAVARIRETLLLDAPPPLSADEPDSEEREKELTKSRREAMKRIKDFQKHSETVKMQRLREERERRQQWLRERNQDIERTEAEIKQMQDVSLKNAFSLHPDKRPEARVRPLKRLPDEEEEEEPGEHPVPPHKPPAKQVSQDTTSSASSKTASAHDAASETLDENAAHSQNGSEAEAESSAAEADDTSDKQSKGDSVPPPPPPPPPLHDEASASGEDGDGTSPPPLPPPPLNTDDTGQSDAKDDGTADGESAPPPPPPPLPLPNTAEDEDECPATPLLSSNSFALMLQEAAKGRAARQTERRSVSQPPDGQDDDDATANQRSNSESDAASKAAEARANDDTTILGALMRRVVKLRNAVAGEDQTDQNGANNQSSSDEDDDEEWE